MIYTAAFRYKGKEYYTEMSPTAEVTFGSHKTDTIVIPGAGDYLLMLSQKEGTPYVKVSPTGGLEMPAAGVTLNRIEKLTQTQEARLYLSRVSGMDSRRVTLPYSGAG